MDHDLLETLRDAQRFGFFGSRPIEEAVAHADGYVDAIGDLPPGARVVDLGSGGGLPGLVVAHRYPHVRVTLVDRREKRTDFLRRAATRLRYEHVEIVATDVQRLVDDVSAGRLAPFDVVTARGFGPPSVTLAFAVELLAPGGRIVISEPPTGDRWDPDLLDGFALTREPVGHVSVFRHTTVED